MNINKLRKIIKEILIEGYAESGFLGGPEDVDKDLNTHTGSFEDVERIANLSASMDDANEWLDWNSSAKKTHLEDLSKSEGLKDLVIRLRKEGMTIGEISKETFKAGYTSRKGNPINLNTILDIIKRNKKEIGEEKAKKIVKPKGRSSKKPIEDLPENSGLKDLIVRFKRHRLTSKEISKKLYDAGYKSKNGKPLSDQTINGIIKRNNIRHGQRDYVEDLPQNKGLKQLVKKLKRKRMTLEQIEEEVYKAGYLNTKGNKISRGAIFQILKR